MKTLIVEKYLEGHWSRLQYCGLSSIRGHESCKRHVASKTKLINKTLDWPQRTHRETIAPRENGAGSKVFKVAESKVRVFLVPAGNNL